MSTTGNLLFYRARADQARAEAEVATLEHVRERCRRSEDAWTQLAERAQRAEDSRHKHELTRAATAAETSDDQNIEDRGL